MKRLIYCLLVVIAFVKLSACANNSNNSEVQQQPHKQQTATSNPQAKLITTKGIGLLDIGKPFSKALKQQWLANGYKIDTLPERKYSKVDGPGSEVLLVSYRGKPVFELLFESNAKQKLRGIVVLSSDYKLEGGLSVGMSLRKIVAKYKEVKLAPDFITFREQLLQIPELEVGSGIQVYIRSSDNKPLLNNLDSLKEHHVFGGSNNFRKNGVVEQIEIWAK